MRLFVLRHGQAETFAPSDAERNLTQTGRSEVRRVIRRNAKSMSWLDKMWVSPLLRARQTADVVEEELGKLDRETSDLLLPESSPSHVLEMLSGVEDGTYLLVTHQPLAGELVNGLCGKLNGFYAMDTGALANIKLDVPALGCGDLVWLR